MNRPMPCPPPQCSTDWADEVTRCWNDWQRLQQIITSITAADIQALQLAIKNLNTQITNLNTQVTNITNNAMPVKGVTDGSNAAAGNVGEFIRATVSVPYAAYPTDTDTMVDCLLVPAGDWTITANVWFSGAVGPIDAMVMNAQEIFPTGMSHGMLLVNGTWSAAGESMALPLPTARASFATATMVPIRIMVKQSVLSGLLAGTANVIMEARRMR